MLKTIIFATLLSATSVGFAQDLFVRNEPLQMERMQKLLPSQHLRDYPILPLGGDWLYQMSKSYDSQKGGVTFGRLAAIDIRDKKMFAGLDMKGNLNNPRLSDWIDEPCKREDFLWKRNTGGKFKNVNCASINHWVDFTKNVTGDFQQLLVYQKDIGTDIPPTVLMITFTRYGENGKWLSYEVAVNPEYFGVARDATSPWGTNSWHKSFIERDAQKVQFLANLIKWTEAVQDRMENAYAKKPDAFVGLKPLESYFGVENTVPVKTSAPSSASSVEERVKKLKSLLEKGLITEAQFNEQLKDILNN
jgi:hypothetical protein